MATATSASAGRGDVTKNMKYVRQSVSIRQDKWEGCPWRENSFLVPLPCRRTASVISEFLPLTPFRSKSARPAPFTAPTTPAHGMQRPHHRQQHHQQQQQHHNNNNVSVAGLYDWSPERSQERDESLSISRLYREIAGGVGASVPRSLSEKVRPKVGVGGLPNGGVSVSMGGSRLSPGRMFLRDKGMLTKGEREIIEGIYRNRGDLQKKETVSYQSRTDFYVRSHHDAWLVGKPGVAGNKPSTEVPRDQMPRGGLLEVMAPANQMTEDGSHDGSNVCGEGGEGGGGCSTCIMCIKEQQLLQQLQQQRQQQQQEQHHHHQQQQQHHNSSSSPRSNSHTQGSMPQRRRRPLNSNAARERAHKLQLTQHPAAPSLPPNSILRPINVNDTFRPNGEEGPNAPPTSPTTNKVWLASQFSPPPLSNPLASSSSSSMGATSNSEKLLKKRQKQNEHWKEGEEHGSDSEGSVSIDSEGNVTRRKRGGGGGGGGKKKVQVKVVLPQVASEPAEEVEVKAHHPNQHKDPRASIVMQGRPALARSERHLTHSDIKTEQENNPHQLHNTDDDNDDNDDDHNGPLQSQDPERASQSHKAHPKPSQVHKQDGVGNNGVDTSSQQQRRRQDRNSTTHGSNGSSNGGSNGSRNGGSNANGNGGSNGSHNGGSRNGGSNGSHHGGSNGSRHGGSNTGSLAGSNPGVGRNGKRSPNGPNEEKENALNRQSPRQLNPNSRSKNESACNCDRKSSRDESDGEERKSGRCSGGCENESTHVQSPRKIPLRTRPITLTLAGDGDADVDPRLLDE